MLDLITPSQPLAVVPVLVGPLQALLAILPGLLVALGTAVLALFSPRMVKAIARLLWSQKFPMLLILAAAGAIVFFGPRLLAGKATVSAAAAGADWPLWRGSLDRRGAAGDDDPTRGGIRWAFTDGKMKTFYASPAVVGNRVYVTSARYEYFTDKGAVYSLDADTGKIVWSYDADGYRATFSSPAVSGRYLVVGEGLHLTKDSRVHCLDVAASEAKRAGVALWTFRTKSHVESSPAIADGKAVIGAGDDGLYCFALDGDGKGGPKVLWHLEGEKYPDCEASPAIEGGKVYFCLGNVGQAVVCVELATGKELWRVPTPYPVFGPPTLADGKVFVGMGTGNYVETAEQVAAIERAKMEKEGKSAAEIEEVMKRMAPIGEVWCIDLATHEVAWKFTVARTILGAVAAADGPSTGSGSPTTRLYFGSHDKNLYCVSAAGTLVGKWNARAPIITSPSVGKKHVYVVTAAGTLFALDRETLAPVWQADLGAESMSSPAVARGHVYVGTTGQGLLCAGEPGVEAPATWDGYLGGPGKSGWDGSPVPDRGRFAWRWPAAPADGGEPKVPKIAAPPAYFGGTLYVGTNWDNGSGLTALKIADDAAAAPQMQWFAAAEGPVTSSPAANAARVFFIDSGREGERGAVRCLDARTGKPVPQRAVPASRTAALTLVPRYSFEGDLVLVDDGAGHLSAETFEYSRTVGPHWSADIGNVVGMPLVLGDIAVAATGKNLVALDLPTGKALWNVPLFPETGGPVLAGGVIWASYMCGLAPFEVDNGSSTYAAQQWGWASSPIVAGGGKFAFTNTDGDITLVEADTRGDVAVVQGALPGFPPMLAGNVMLYFSPSAIMRYDIESKKSAVWFPLPEWMGKPTTPMIMVRSNVYFATDKLGLVCVKPRR